MSIAPAPSLRLPLFYSETFMSLIFPLRSCCLQSRSVFEGTSQSRRPNLAVPCKTLWRKGQARTPSISESRFTHFRRIVGSCSPLLLLPQEIQDEIYDYVLAGHIIHIRGFEQFKDCAEAPSIFSRLYKREANASSHTATLRRQTRPRGNAEEVSDHSPESRQRQLERELPGLSDKELCRFVDCRPALGTKGPYITSLQHNSRCRDFNATLSTNPLYHKPELCVCSFFSTPCCEIWHTTGSSSPHRNALLQTCRQIYQAASPILYEKNVFSFEEFGEFENDPHPVPYSGALPQPTLFQTFCARLQPASLTFLRSLSLFVDVWPVRFNSSRVATFTTEYYVNKLRVRESWKELISKEHSDHGLSRLTGLRHLTVTFGVVRAFMRGTEPPGCQCGIICEFINFVPIREFCRGLGRLNVGEICISLKTWVALEEDPDPTVMEIEEVIRAMLRDSGEQCTDKVERMASHRWKSHLWQTSR